MNKVRLAPPMRPAASLPVLLLCAPVLAGCFAPAEAAPDAMATFYPLAFLAQRIGGPDLTVGTAVPAGVEPHDWEPSPQDVTRLAGARVILAQGAGFEPWLPDLLANLGGRAPPLVETTRGIELRGGEDGDEAGGRDPHTWLDPVLLARQSQAVEDALVAAFPDRADAMRTRGAALRADLDALHAEMEAGLRACEVDVIVANHDAYGYLAARYGFRVEAVSGLSPEAEPSPADLARVVEVAREHNLTVVFFEELVSPRVAQAVAREVGATTRVLSPAESAPGEGDYLSLQRANLAGLREAMRCA